jgi:hypothetical protein
MLGGEERGELHTGRLEQEIDRARSASIASRVIRQQPNAFAADQMQRIAQQHLDAGNDTA